MIEIILRNQPEGTDHAIEIFINDDLVHAGFVSTSDLQDLECCLSNELLYVRRKLYGTELQR